MGLTAIDDCLGPQWHLWVNAVVGIYLLIMLALPGPKAVTARVWYVRRDARVLHGAYAAWLTSPCCRSTKLALETLQREAQADVTAELVAKVTLTCFSAVRTGLILLDLVRRALLPLPFSAGVSQRPADRRLTPTQAWVAALLVELWLCLVIGHYLDELADREAAARFGVDIESPEPPYRFERIGSAGAEQEEEMRMLQGRRVAKVSRAW